MMKLFGAGLLVALVGLWLAWPGLTWPAVKARIRNEFPAVRAITTSELAAELGSDDIRPVLVDVRTVAEFEVSHLASARWVDPDGTAAQVVVAKDAPIVTYCSVGYRSAAFAQRLQAAGFTHVRNLEGSIFAWANEGRPLVNARGPAEKVHPYNRKWGRLLDAARRADATPAK